MPSPPSQISYGISVARHNRPRQLGNIPGGGLTIAVAWNLRQP